MCLLYPVKKVLSIKAVCDLPKNFLFANTARGAKSSAVIFSLIETAKENGLDPYAYLLHIFRTAPHLDRASTDWVLPLLPENAPDKCKVNI